MSRNVSGTDPHRRTTVLWAAGAAAAAVLVLAVSGTLSSWTSAIITNDHNTTSSAPAVRLVESQGGTTCDTGTSPTNSVTCSHIDKYGGTAAPMSPGDTHTVQVVLTNQGTGDGELTLAAAACAAKDAAGDPAANDACGVFVVRLTCTNGFTTGPTALADFTGGDVGALAAGDSTTCTFDVTLPNGTPAVYASQTLSQTLTWTLAASA